MSRNQEMVEHIILNPNDDEARLVYADYLSGQGDPRGEFVSVQVRLAGRITPARRKWLRQLEKELLEKHYKTFTEASQTAGLQGQLRRGFVDEVKGSASAFVKGGPALLAVEPVQRVSLEGGGDKQLVAMIGGGLLGRLRSLRMCGGKVGDKGLAALAASEQLASLRILNLSSNQIGDAGLAALVSSPHFDLESLTLNENQITSAGLTALATAAATHSLRRLHLGRNNIDAAGVIAVIASTHLHDLEILSLSGNADIGDGGVAAFIEPELAGRMKRVELEQIEISRSTRTRVREVWGKRMMVDSY